MTTGNPLTRSDLLESAGEAKALAFSADPDGPA